MYRSILVPLDGSKMGEQALPLALDIARRAGATVHLVHVCGATLLDAVDGAPTDRTPATSRGRARHYLDRLAERLADETDVAVSTALLDPPESVVHTATIADTLCRHMADIGTDLIVMTTHGRGGLARFWLGSVADTLVRRSGIPIMLLRPHEVPAEPHQLSALRRILVPLDGSLEAEAILDPVLELGTLMQAEYTLFHAISPFILAPALIGDADSPTPEEPEARIAQRLHEAEQYLERIAGRLRTLGYTVQTRAIFTQHPATAILHQAYEQGCGTIAMSTHGRGGVARLLIGSVADKVLRSADGPVLLYRPDTP
ncbi:MAG TPA: universal stress protein [Roseiflexaceae bacterium]|nr:universal stress protein [Roseiflexaceae bacterium]